MGSTSKHKIQLFIINGKQLRICPELAVEIGLNESIALLQLEYLIGISNTEEVDGELWTYQSLNDLKTEYFPFWSVATIWRAVKSLEAQHCIKTGRFNRVTFDKTLWYRLDRTGLQTLQSVKVNEAIFQNEKSKRSKRKMDIDKMKNGYSKMKNRSAQNETTIPEIPTEISTESSTEILSLGEVDLTTIQHAEQAVGVWDSIQSQLRSSMKPSDYRTWIEPVRALGFNYDDRLVLSAVNSYSRDWVMSRLETTITRMLPPLTGRQAGLAVIVQP